MYACTSSVRRLERSEWITNVRLASADERGEARVACAARCSLSLQQERAKEGNNRDTIYSDFPTRTIVTQEERTTSPTVRSKCLVQWSQVVISDPRSSPPHKVSHLHILFFSAKHTRIGTLFLSACISWPVYSSRGVWLRTQKCFVSWLGNVLYSLCFVALG